MIFLSFDVEGVKRDAIIALPDFFSSDNIFHFLVCMSND